MSIKVLVVDDHEMVCEGFKALLERTKDFEVVGMAANGFEAIKFVCKLSVDVVVMDVSMPEMNGIETAREMLAVAPSIRILALSMHDDEQYVKRMIEAGAHGYILKESATAELVDAIRTVAVGRAYFSAKLTEGVLCRTTTERGAQSALSPRERQTLQLVSEGSSSKEIAAKLGVSSKTIETYRQRLMEKLNVRSVAELTKQAIREGLTSA